MARLSGLAIFLPTPLDCGHNNLARLFEIRPNLTTFGHEPVNDRAEKARSLSQRAGDNERADGVFLTNSKPFLVLTKLGTKKYARGDAGHQSEDFRLEYDFCLFFRDPISLPQAPPSKAESQKRTFRFPKLAWKSLASLV